MSLFFLSNLVFCSLKSQVLIPGVASEYIRDVITPIKLFRPYKFDTSTVLIGIDFTDSTNGRAGIFNFIINDSKDLAEIKKNWIITSGLYAGADRGIFKVFYTSNKVIKGSWVIFPRSHSLVAMDGLYGFDPALILTLHDKSPLVHNTRIDTLKSKSAYLRFNDSVKAIPAFLFLMEPEILCDGSFEVTLKASSHMLPEEVGERIIKTCNKTKPSSPFQVYVKPNEGTGDVTRKTYIVKGDRSLFEQFSHSEMEKNNWTPATYVIQSFWRSL